MVVVIFITTLLVEGIIERGILRYKLSIIEIELVANRASSRPSRSRNRSRSRRGRDLARRTSSSRRRT